MIEPADVFFFAAGLALGVVAATIVEWIKDFRERRKRPQATRIVLQIKEINMPQSFTLKVGKSYLVTPQPVGDTGEPEHATGFAYSLDSTVFGTLTPASDGSSATLVVLLPGVAKLTVTATNDAGSPISGEGDLTAAAPLATSINLQITEQ